MASTTQTYTVDRWKVGPGIAPDSTIMRIAANAPPRVGDPSMAYNEYEQTAIELGGLPGELFAGVKRGATLKITIEIVA